MPLHCRLRRRGSCIDQIDGVNWLSGINYEEAAFGSRTSRNTKVKNPNERHERVANEDEHWDA